MLQQPCPSPLLSSSPVLSPSLPYISPQLNAETLSLSSPPPQPLPLLLLKYTLILLGILWGIPWIHSCSSALSFLSFTSPDPFNQFLCGLIITYSILTISIDGVWIMTSIYQVTFNPVKTKLQLRQTYKYQRRLLAVSFLVGLVSSVPGVYASYTFNEGARKYLAVIILFGNVGLSTFGFYSMGFEVWDRVKSRRGREKDEGMKFLEGLQGKYYKLLQHYNRVKQYDSLLYTGDYKDLVSFTRIVQSQTLTHSLMSSSLTPSKPPFSSVLSFIPLIFGILISASQSLIDIILTYNLLLSLSFPSILSYCLSSLMTIPNLFVSFISSRQVTNKVISLFRCKPESKLDLCRKLPLINPLTFLISLLAFFSPLAGCYITYETLKGNGIDHGVVVSAVVTIFVARFCFSNFTIRLVWREVMGRKADARGKKEEQRVKRMFELVRKVHPKYFSEGKEAEDEDQIGV